MLDLGDTTFYEKVNHVKLNYILKNRNKYEGVIECHKNENGNAHEQSIWAIMKKMYKKIIKIPYSEFGYIPVNYVKGKSCNNIGRWYADGSIGLAPIKSCIRHTLCDDMWVDIDQVNSHPELLKQIMHKYEYSSALLNNYINKREDILTIIMEEEKCSRDDAKDSIISTINGKKYKTNTLLQLCNEIKPAVDKIMRSDEFKHIYDYCKNAFGIKCNMQGKVMSRILQLEENNMLECYIEFCKNKGLIPKYNDGYVVSLVFDGFQLINHDDINDDLLEELRLYAKQHTGYDIQLKLKPFDKALAIPDDYNFKEEEDDDEEHEDDVPDDVLSYEDYKREFELTHAKICFPPSVYTINDDKDEMQNFKGARDSYCHLKCYITKSVVKNKKTHNIKECKPFIHLWLADKDIKCYKRISWKPPPLINDECDFNTWKPFDICKIDLEKSSRNYYQEFLTFCENLFESKEVMNYLLARYAFRLQNPGLRTNLCVVYFGVEGTGKSTFIDTIYSVFGKYAIQIDKAKKLYESHSTFEKEKCFICVNEAGGTDNFENSEVLKTRITENKLYINPKGLQAYEIDNYCDYDMTTNNVNVIKITDHSSRRWFQNECTTHYLGDIEFFNDYRKNILNNTNAIKQIYDGLMDYDWKDVIKSGNFQDANYKPDTLITKTVKECNRDKIIWFFKDLTEEKEKEEDDDGDEIKLCNKGLFHKWNEWCVENKIEYRLNNIQFGIKVKMVCVDVNNKIKRDFCDKYRDYYIFYKNVFREYIEILDR